MEFFPYWKSSIIHTHSAPIASIASFQNWLSTAPITIKHDLTLSDLPRAVEEPTLMYPPIFLFAFFSIFLYHTRHEIPIYQRKFHKRKIFLYLHVLAGGMDTFRYRLDEVLHGPSDPLPDKFGVLCCLLWSVTAFELVKTLRRGDPRTTRPPYQVGAMLRPVACLISYFFGLPAFHRLSISALDSFIYARLAIFFFTYTPYIRSYSRSTIYAISIPLAATLSVHESRVPGASLIFVLASAYVARLNEWVTHESRYLRKSEVYSASVSSYWKSMIAMLVRLGFVELEELREVTKARELEKAVVDQYVPTSKVVI